MQGRNEDLTKWYDFHARQYDAALGRWFGVDPQDQFASPYLAMGNNPVMGIDPDGEFVLPAMLIGAALGGGFNFISGSANGLRGNDLIRHTVKGLFVGAASGLVGGAIGAQVALSSNLGAFAVGALSGAAGGAGGGFTAGFLNSSLSGGSFEQSFKAGLIGGGIGGVTGGLLGGLSSGLASRAERHGFWNGQRDISGSLLACTDCAFQVNLPAFDIFTRSLYNPVAEGVRNAGASFWGHPVTQGAVFAATSLIGGGIASQFLRAGARAANVGNVARSGMNQVQYAARTSTTVFQKHHIIPNQVFKTFKADLSAMGWKQNSMMNLKKLPTPFHGNHPAYNKFVMREMSLLKQSGNLNLKSMQHLQHKMRLMVGDAYRSGGNLNQYFKFY